MRTKDKLLSKSGVERSIAIVSNWFLVKLAEPPIFSTEREQESRYWRELVCYVRNLFLRILNRIPPIPLKDVPHTELHPYKGVGRPCDKTLEYPIDSCYLDPPLMNFCSLEQLDEIIKEAEAGCSNIPKEQPNG